MIGRALDAMIALLPAAASAQAMGQPQAMTMAQPAACAAPAPLPPGLDGFRAPVPVKADGDAVKVGQAATLALAPGAGLGYPIMPSRPGAPGTFGGFASLAIAAAGPYRFALSEGAWLEVAKGGALMTSIGHTPGPACSGVRKMVDFHLEPGTYMIEIAGNRERTVTLLVARLP